MDKAKSETEESLVDSSEKEEARIANANYEAIATVISCIQGHEAGFEGIKIWQSLWAKGAEGDNSASGEILTSLSGLLAIDIIELSNPKSPRLKETVHKAAAQKARDGTLAEFIAKNFETINRYDLNNGEDIKLTLLMGEKKVTPENIQVCLDRILNSGV